MTSKYICFLAICLLLISLNGCTDNKKTTEMQQPELGTRGAAIIEQEDLKFKDLNKNGKLDAYEDWRLLPAERSIDLLQRMT
ncbi:MAG TPA: hypothetical protein PLS00_17700, partial [Niabella sp.]|nr:hypothetical protein [Niabella sp.]